MLSILIDPIFCVLVKCCFFMNSHNKKEEKNKTGDAFQDFQEQTKDAWDDGEDDLMLDMANIKMSMRDIKSTANAVIEKHKSRNANLQYGGGRN